jgi:hypothetical protein
MKKSDLYLKIVEWSDEDQCYIGRAPGLTFGGVDGDDEKRVYEELCDVVEEVIQIIEEDGEPEHLLCERAQRRRRIVTGSI